MSTICFFDDGSDVLGKEGRFDQAHLREEYDRANSYGKELRVLRNKVSEVNSPAAMANSDAEILCEADVCHLVENVDFASFQPNVDEIGMHIHDAESINCSPIAEDPQDPYFCAPYADAQAYPCAGEPCLDPISAASNFDGYWESVRNVKRFWIADLLEAIRFLLSQIKKLKRQIRFLQSTVRVNPHSWLKANFGKGDGLVWRPQVLLT